MGESNGRVLNYGINGTNVYPKPKAQLSRSAHPASPTSVNVEECSDRHAHISRRSVSLHARGTPLTSPDAHLLQLRRIGFLFT